MKPNFLFYINISSCNNDEKKQFKSNFRSIYIKGIVTEE